MPTQREKSQQVFIWLAPLALLVLVAIAYRDAPGNTFHFDDQSNIVRHPPVIISELTVDNVNTQFGATQEQYLMLGNQILGQQINASDYHEKHKLALQGKSVFSLAPAIKNRSGLDLHTWRSKWAVEN